MSIATLLMWAAGAFGGYRIGGMMRQGQISTLTGIQLAIILMLLILIEDMAHVAD